MDAPATEPPAAPAPSPAPAGRRGPRVERHLVLVNRRGWQDPNDLYLIAAKVRWLDPTIGTFVVPGDLDDGVTRDAAASLPSLVVSFGPLGKFQPARGRVYQGRPIQKFEQLKRLDAAGISVPMTMMLGPDTALDPQRWGEFVIVKPTDIASSSHGSGIQLMRTSRVRYIAPQDYPEGHPGRQGPMVVQQFIDTGSPLSAFRVMTLFDEPLICQRATAMTERPPLSSDDAVLETAIITTQGHPNAQKRKDFVYDADVIALARKASRVIPEIPLKGVDILRDRRTGRVYVLELNPGGNTWHFSSDFMASARAEDPPELSRQRLAQFDAFASAAHILVDRVRAEAE